MTPSDSLVGRVYREFINSVGTLISIQRVRTILMDKAPKHKHQVPVGMSPDGVAISVSVAQEVANVTLSTVVEYYIGLQVLMHAWTFCGTHLVESKLKPGTHVTYFEYGRGFSYYSFCLRRTMEYAPPGNELEWLRSKDELTRGSVVVLTREGWPAGEALVEALKEHTMEWKSTSQSAPADHAVHLQPNAAPLDGGRKRKRSPSSDPHRSSGKNSGGRNSKQTTSQRDVSWGAAHIVSTGRGNKRLCSAFQRNNCSEPCPRQQLHECWLKVKGQGHCGKTGRKHSAIDCTNRSTTWARS